MTSYLPIFVIGNLSNPCLENPRPFARKQGQEMTCPGTRKRMIGDDALNQQEIQYMFSGEICFFREFRIFWITRSEDLSSPWDPGSKKITITCIPGSQDAVKRLISEVRQAGLKRNSDNIPVYLSESTSHNVYWEL